VYLRAKVSPVHPLYNTLSLFTQEKKMETRELTFKQEKETQNTVRYQEQVEDGEAKVIGPLYVQKSALGENPPQVLSVAVGIPADGVPDAVQQAQELLQRWDDEESADEELEAAKVGFTDAELGL
jgi:hypothetical protein